MKLESQVTSRELSERLEKLGVKQESLVCWVRGKIEYGYEGEWSIQESEEHFLFTENLGSRPDAMDFSVDFGEYDEEGKWIQKQSRLRNKRAKEVYAAFTVGELGEMLPYGCWSQKDIAGRWFAQMQNTVSLSSVDTEAEERGLMLEYLIKNKLITIYV